MVTEMCDSALCSKIYLKADKDFEVMKNVFSFLDFMSSSYAL